MNIILSASSYKPNIGGVEEAVCNLANQYQKLGHKVTVVTNKWPEELPEKEVIEGIEIYRFRFYLPSLSISSIAKFLRNYRSEKAKFINFLNNATPDIMHIQCVSSNGFYALMAKKALNIPLITTLQGETLMDDYDIYNKSIIMRWILRQLMKKSDWVTANSSYILDDALANYGGSGSKSSVVFNGIDLDEFNKGRTYSHKRPYIFATGRLVYKKGFDLLIKAFKKICNQYKDIDLLISGRGEYQAKLQAIIKDLGLQERVHLLGPANRELNVSLFKGCEFFVMPSRLEPFGIVALEAMAAGKPVIVTTNGGTKEFVTEDFGILVNPEDTEKLAGALKKLLSDKANREKMGKKAKEEVKDFDWSNIANEYMDIYSEVLDKNA